MSRASIVAAAADLPRPEIYGIGACRVGTDFVDFEIGWDEVDRDTDWATAALTASGIGPGDVVLITVGGWEGPWFTPVINGLHRIGAVFTPAETYSWDARRTAHLVKSLHPKAHIGLGAETLEGLGGLDEDPAKLFADMDVIWARHDALRLVAEHGLHAEPIVPLGPALAFGIPGVGTVVNSAEWAVTESDAGLLVSTRGDRATAFTDVVTGVAGRVGADTPHGTVVELDI